MKRLLILLITFLFFSITGCSTTAINYKSELSAIKPDQNSAYVIIGQKISPTSDITSLIPVLYSDGKRLPNKGVSTTDSVPNLIPISVYKGTNYVKTNKRGHAYRIWEIKNINVSKNILFLHGVISNQSVYAPIHSGPWHLYPMPIAFTQDLNIFTAITTKNFKNWSYYGCPFQINKPGIFYLGEIEISKGKISENLSQSFITKKLSDFNMHIYSDISTLKPFIDEANLSNLPIHNLSNSWTLSNGVTLKNYIDGL